jgi:folate-binding protein YgfZ
MTLAASGITSLPMPSPGITATFFFSFSLTGQNGITDRGSGPQVLPCAFRAVPVRARMRPELLSYNQSSMHIAAQDEQNVVSSSGDVRQEFRTLVSACGLYKLDRAQIALTGSDRVRWLNGMVTNNVRDLATGRGVYAFLLNPQGKIQAELYAFNRGESLLVETGRAQLEPVLQIFDRYIIMDDVEVENLTGKLNVIGLAGPKSREVLTAVGFGQELAALQFADVKLNGSQGTLVRGDNPCVENYELWIPAQDWERAWQALASAGAQEIHENALEMFRIVCGIPKFGQDIRERDLPQETSQDRALNFTKGCYIGQEIVERIRSRGAVHRTFVGFEIDGKVSPGTRIQNEGKDVGEITSVATVFAANGQRVIALGYIRKEFTVPGKDLVAGGAKVRVVTLPFSGIFEKA